MRERVDDTLPLHAMVEIVHLSPYHFTRVFRQVTGIPPGEFLAALRLERAKQLPLTTDLSVAEICFEVGYNSPGTFTTRFTRLVGLSPGRVRNLPEQLHTTFSHVDEEDRPLLPVAPASRGVPFRISGAGLARTWIFVGLFPSAIPQGRPVGGLILTAPGTYRLAPVPDGHYHLMAAALPRSEGPLKFLLPGAKLRVGRSRDPLVVRAGETVGQAEVEMRPPHTTDPPILISLPALLLKMFST